MIDAKLLIPLDEIYNGQWPEKTVAYFTESDGHKYGINNTVVWAPYVYYNTKIFADLKLEPPKTWDEFFTIAKKVREAGLQPLLAHVDIMNIHIPSAIISRVLSPAQFADTMKNWSPSASEESKQFKWTGPEGVRIFTIIRDMVKDGLIADNYAGFADQEQAKGLFTSGKAAMLQSGSYSSKIGDDAAGFTVDYFNYPPIDSAAAGNTSVGAWLANCFIGFNRQHSEEAKKVLKFLSTSEAMVAYTKADGETMARTDIPDDVTKQLVDPLAARMVAEATRDGADPLWQGAVPSDILNELIRVTEQVQAGTMSPEDAAADMEKAYERSRSGG